MERQTNPWVIVERRRQEDEHDLQAIGLWGSLGFGALFWWVILGPVLGLL
jgi:hypothetical protein